MDLFVRAARNDHTVIDKLCASASAGLWAAPRLPLSGLVADANVALARPQLEKIATLAGIPYLIDPVTPLLQDEQPTDNSWTRLSFATPQKRSPSDFEHPYVQDELVEGVLDFQRANGATMLIPPYFYSAKRADTWFDLNLRLLRRSARYLKHEGVGLPIVPVFAASLAEYGPQSTWADGLDRYMTDAAALNVSRIALSWSTSQPGKEGYSGLAHLLAATRHAASGVPVVGWRQGLYGPALVAVGASGYETGAGQDERCNYPAFMARRRPQPIDSRGSVAQGGAYIYFANFGRSLRRKTGRALLDNQRLRGVLVCTDTQCCPAGAESMVKQWREHAVRSRARELHQLEQMPASPAWMLNEVARRAEQSLADAQLANTALEAAGIAERLPTETFRSLRRVADELRDHAAMQVA